MVKKLPLAILSGMLLLGFAALPSIQSGPMINYSKSFTSTQKHHNVALNLTLVWVQIPLQLYDAFIGMRISAIVRR